MEVFTEGGRKWGRKRESEGFFGVRCFLRQPHRLTVTLNGLTKVVVVALDFPVLDSHHHPKPPVWVLSAHPELKWWTSRVPRTRFLSSDLLERC